MSKCLRERRDEPRALSGRESVATLGPGQRVQRPWGGSMPGRFEEAGVAGRGLLGGGVGADMARGPGGPWAPLAGLEL